MFGLCLDKNPKKKKKRSKHFGMNEHKVTEQPNSYRARYRERAVGVGGWVGTGVLKPIDGTLL